MRRFRWVLPLLLAACAACRQGKEGNTDPPDPGRMKEKLIRVNKQFVRNQLDDIDAYIRRKGYRMDSTETGLRYAVYHPGDGPKPGPENKVTIRYRTSLLDGRECYSSDSLGPLTFSMGYDDVPGGLREGVALMGQGDTALLILPAHLAYGLTGDGGKVPPNAALVMRVELLKVE
jgi:FKBP-type peptidyl-prolyl cis-trans isomerase